ncbi:hypothetical protein AF332_10475 [Sporosarcina globispora]|uniref:LysM domain-containing protein n=1 Tax=Sporosarcina globispora TaxID=1459 RepID=A0A0M0GBQ9_SPOGL|nr:LysM peptidoglycan-binding domain-containing protein [Sporosarcina globispora]KON87198.1 hypothetical protein AF332_10475 [Sporosarcina globispora]
MNKEDPYRDQAERLRKKIDRKQETEKNGQKSALPPRSRVHQEKRKKNKWKVKYPVIRLLALFFILLPIIIFSIYQYVSTEKSISAGGSAENEETGFETVGFATNDEDKETTIEVREDTESQKPEEPENAQEKEDTKVKQPQKQESQKADSGDKGSEPDSQNQAQQKAPASTDSPKTTEAQKQEETKKESKIVYHTVKPKETIFRIAMTYYKSQAGIEIIKKANNLPSNEIQTGQVLKIPLEQ